MTAIHADASFQTGGRSFLFSCCFSFGGRIHWQAFKPSRALAQAPIRGGRSAEGAAAECGLKATPHTFRHCFATHLLRHGASIRYIQQLLGHDKLDTTERYTHLTTDDLKAAVEAAHEIIAANIAKP